MKKTLITAAITLMGVAVSLGDTLTVQKDGAARWENKSYYGFAVDFSADTIFKLDGEVTDRSAYESLTLTSVSLNVKSGMDDVKLAVYKVADDMTVGSWPAGSELFGYDSYLGVSGVGQAFDYNGVEYADRVANTATFTFDDSITLDPDGWYAFVFVKSDVDESVYSAATESKGLTQLAYENAWSKYVEFVDSDNWGDKMQVGGGNQYKGWASGKTANATFAFSVVPEPATAALSLLALAGLAVRRRRK